MWTRALCCLLVVVVVGTAARNERILTVDERVELGDVLDAGYDVERPGGEGVEATTPRTALEVPRETAERLRIILKDRYLRSPLAVAVDTEPRALEFTKRLWAATLKDMDGDGINLVLLPFNSSAMSSSYLTKGIQWFLDVLDGVTPVPVAPPGAGGVAFYSILKATEQIPFDSAILVFTGRPAVDEYLAQLTTATLIQKRCKLHVIWCGPGTTASSGGSESLLREVIDQTGGEFLATGYVDKEMFAAPTRQPNRATPKTEPPATQEVVLAMRRQLLGNTAIPLSVDSTVRKIHVTIEGAVRAATLRSPTGTTIDLLSDDALRRWPSGGATVLAATGARLELELDTSATTPGVWTLTTASERRHDVSVAAVSGLGVSAAIFEVVDNDRVDGEPAANASSLLRLTLVGVGSVDSVALVDAQGQELRRLTYQRRDDAVEASSLDADPNEQVTTDLDLPDDLRVPQNTFVRVSGIDPTGAAFSRVSPVSERQVVASSYPFVPGVGAGVGAVTIGVAANTSLYTLPNTWHSLVFTVTNNRNVATQYRFGARDDRGFIRYVRPDRAYIGGRLTYNVAVVMLAPPSTPYGTTDTVTLVVQGPGEVTNKSGTITIGDRVIDSERPQVTHSIKTNCRGYTEPHNCQTRVWNAEIELIDRDSGILDIVSQPPGIRFMTDFVAGTKSTVVAYYSATCCENKVDITVTDTNGNYVKYFINGDDSFVLSAGEIAAITCGCLLIIILIVCIILAVCICKKNRSKSHDLPVHPRARHN